MVKNRPNAPCPTQHGRKNSSASRPSCSARTTTLHPRHPAPHKLSRRFPCAWLAPRAPSPTSASAHAADSVSKRANSHSRRAACEQTRKFSLRICAPSALAAIANRHFGGGSAPERHFCRHRGVRICAFAHASPLGREFLRVCSAFASLGACQPSTPHAPRPAPTRAPIPHARLPLPA